MSETPTKEDWEASKFNNENLIKTNLIQIQMAEEIIKLCDRKIKEFPVQEVSKPQIPIGVG